MTDGVMHARMRESHMVSAQHPHTGIERQGLTVDEAAHMLGIGRVTLYALHKQGKIRFVKLNNRTIVPRAEIHAHLYDPRASVEWSNMPSFRHLYILQKEQAGGSPKALKLRGEFRPKSGYEVVPSTDAELLVDYLLSLKKDAPIPGTITTEAKK